MFIVFFISTFLAIQLNAMEEQSKEDSELVDGSITVRELFRNWSSQSENEERMQWQRFRPKTKGPTILWWSSSDPIGEEQVERIWQEIPHQEPITLEIMEVTGERSMDFFLAELREAEHKFNDSYVRMSYFLLKWPSKYLNEAPDMRQRVMDALISRGLVELYNNAADGVLAIRSVHLKQVR